MFFISLTKADGIFLLEFSASVIQVGKLHSACHFFVQYQEMQQPSILDIIQSLSDVCGAGFIRTISDPVVGLHVVVHGLLYVVPLYVNLAFRPLIYIKLLH